MGEKLKMWNINHILSRKENKGFTLIEVVFSLCICSVIILTLSYVLNHYAKMNRKVEELDDMYLNGRYLMDYIEGEIKDGDKIISSEKIPDLNRIIKNNMGFVIQRIIDADDKEEYKYITYYHKEETKEIIRLSVSGGNEYPHGKRFKEGGHNSICQHIKSTDTYVDFERSIIRLSFIFDGEINDDLLLETDIFIRCLRDY
jgi:type II secretory pathway pseudopilin PulG